MLLKNWLPLLVIFLSFSACSHGPKLNICISNGQSEFDCNTSKGKESTVSFEDSTGYFVYPSTSLQSALNYCASRKVSGTPPPQFDQCVSSYADGGMNCVHEECSINPESDGVNCIPNGEYFVSFLDSDNFVALSESDKVTLAAYCNINFTEGFK